MIIFTDYRHSLHIYSSFTDIVLNGLAISLSSAYTVKLGELDSLGDLDQT